MGERQETDYKKDGSLHWVKHGLKGSQLTHGRETDKRQKPYALDSFPLL